MSRSMRGWPGAQSRMWSWRWSVKISCTSGIASSAPLLSRRNKPKSNAVFTGRSLCGFDWENSLKENTLSSAPASMSSGLARRFHGGRETLISILVAILLLSGGSPAQENGLSEHQLKAVFLYNFAKFVEWPADSFADPQSS